MGRYLLGIDIGTSSCKVSVFDPNGTTVASASASYPVYYPRSGWVEQNPDDWWAGVVSCLRQIIPERVDAKDIAAVGIDGQSWSAIAIDRNGDVLGNTPIWSDTRAGDICTALNETIGSDEIFGLAGNPLLPQYTTPKVLWYKEHAAQLYRETYKILQSNGFIAYRLTGAVSQDLSQGYGWHCFDMRKGTWDLEMAAALGIEERMLPTIVACDHVVGAVSAQASAQTGLLEGTPVVAGGLDAACGTLGAGVYRQGQTQEQGGQAGGMSICIEEYHADPRLILGMHVVPGTWLLQGGTTGGGGVMRWFEREFADYERTLVQEMGLSSFDQLNLIAQEVPAGSDGVVFLPYMAGERTPIWDPHAKGVFFGLNFATSKGHMVRACMEGVAYSLLHNLEVAESCGVSVGTLHSVGGSSNSPLWMQIKSDVTGKDMMVSRPDEATTLGAAMLAGVGCGLYAGYDEAVGATALVQAEYQPDAKTHAAYAHYYQTYRKLYESLKELMKEVDE